MTSDAPVRLLVVQNDPTDPLGLLGDWWAEAGIAMDVVRADLGEAVPADVPEGYDGVVLLGGEMAAWEDERAPWLPDERRLILDAVDAGTPLLGVCLGGQLMTLATGGVVDRAPAAEVGVYELQMHEAAASDPVFSVLPQGTPVAEYHQDAMLAVPEGAVLLASTPTCPVQGYRLGDRAWAIQFHPEVDAHILESWFPDDTEPLEKAGTDPATIMRDMAEREAEMRSAWKAFALAFADVVRADRATAAAGADRTS